MLVDIDCLMVNEPYGPFKVGKSYRVVGYGYDFVIMKCRGHNYHVPICITTTEVYHAKDNEEVQD